MRPTIRTNSAIGVATIGAGVLASQPQPFPPSPWGDFFLNHRPCTTSQLVSMKERASVMKEKVRQTILDAAASSSLIQKLELVDTLQRIGVDYHYKQEIDELLCHVYNDKDDGGSDDLYITSLRFYLLRKHGYPVSSDVFLKFQDEKGDISIDDDDINILITLYDAAHLRTHGEHILDNIISFNKRRLQFSMEKILEPDLAEEIRLTLETPRFRRVKRVEARRYITVYEKKEARDKTILEFAKLDYNILQALFCEELKELTMWWKEFQTQADTSWNTRDRVVEMHFWMMEVFVEAQYSYSRKMLTQLFMILTKLDDLYDSYCSKEDGDAFLTALVRWDEAAAEHCPTYLRQLYKTILTNVKTIEEELKHQNREHVELVKRLVIGMAKCYHAEAEWRDKKYVPATVEEHLTISIGNTGCCMVGIVYLGDVETTEAIEWILSNPKIVQGVAVISRVANDIVSDKREQASLKHMVSTIQACVKEHGFTTEEAIEKLRELIEEAWMDISEDCLVQPRPTALLERMINLARTMDFLYKDVDGYTESYYIKDTLKSIYVKPIC